MTSRDSFSQWFIFNFDLKAGHLVTPMMPKVGSFPYHITAYFEVWFYRLTAITIQS